MSTNEACDLLKMSRPTFFKRIKDGRIHPLPKQNPALDREPLRFNRADVLALAGKSEPPKEK